jgi:hypothetical protein
MKKTELREMIAEELRSILNENSPTKDNLAGVNRMIKTMEQNLREPAAYDMALRQALVYLADAIALVDTNKGAQ